MAKLTLSDLSSLEDQGSAISSINNNNAAIETAIENTLSRDGAGPNMLLADIDMNSNRILNLPNAVNLQEAATLGQLLSGGVGVTNKLLIGYPSDLLLLGSETTIQVVLDGFTTFPLTINSFSNHSGGANLAFSLSRNPTFGQNGAVIDDDVLGVLSGYGNYGSGYSISGQMRFKADGNPSGTSSPGKIEFRTGRSDGTTNVCLLIRSDGSVTPGTDNEGSLGSPTVRWADLFLADGGVINWNNGNVLLTHSANKLTFTNGSNGYFYDTGPFNLGSTSTLGIASSATPAFVAHCTGNTSGFVRWSTTGGGDNNNCILELCKSNGTSIGNHGALASSQNVGRLSFSGSDGTSFVQSANIACIVDATVSSGIVPGRLSFRTSNTSGSLITRLTIKSDGMLQIGDGVTDISTTKLLINSTTDFNIVGSPTHYQAATNNPSTEFLAVQAGFSADAASPTVAFVKSRNATIGSNTVVNDGDSIGTFNFYGADGSSYKIAARIRAIADGGGANVPGRLELTTGDSTGTTRIGLRVDSSSRVLALRPTGGLGYGTGAGGTVTQATNKTTGVTLNTVCGQITMSGTGAIAADTTVSFTLTNSAIAATDIIVFNHVSGGTIGAYTFNAQCAGGSATINVHNVTPGSLTETPVIGFAVIKAVTS